MRIATWNVNSLRTRIDRVTDFLERENVDVLALQETKVKDEMFPAEPFERLGYQVVHTGYNQWNGVAVASRIPIVDVQVGFPGQPGYGDPEQVEARALGVTVQQDRQPPITNWSLYVPNGREIDHPHFAYKLEWLSKLFDFASARLQANPEVQMALMGDWNIAPLDTDVWDRQFFEGHTHVTPQERAAFARFADEGFEEVTRDRVDNYTYWDYQQLRFPKNQGLRIDFIYASPALAKRVIAADIMRNERKGKQPSDHVPVVIDVA